MSYLGRVLCHFITNWYQTINLKGIIRSNDKIFRLPCYLDSTSVSKTSTENRREDTQPTKNEKNEDSGSDYGGEWSEDEWNDAQVKISPQRLLSLFCFVFLFFLVFFFCLFTLLEKGAIFWCKIAITLYLLQLISALGI